ncbi:MAG: c-type cytochrome domain-containing protein [Pirellula sp.]
MLNLLSRSIGLILLLAPVVQADDLGLLKESLKTAGQQLKAGKVLESSEIVEKSTKSLLDLVASAPAKDLAELKKLHAQLEKAHELLEVQGAELSELPNWDTLLKAKRSNVPKASPTAPSTVPANAKAMSFSRDIAPWMVDQCGQCHIKAERGGFSLATYNALIKGSKGGVVLFPGDPASSRIVETIETGDMPRNGAKVTPENFAKFKQWIKEGAKFDGPTPTDPIASLVNSKSPAMPTPDPKKEPIVIPAATGKETVSFSRDVAPLLISNCNGCHYNGTRNSGGLQFNAFAGLIKGGDSGVALKPTKPEESLLIKKLRGTEGARMPMGRSPLSDEQIQLVATWIQEGATFDGQSKDAKLEQVVSQAWAAKASHKELMEKRMTRAREKWKLVAPKREADEAHDDQIHIIGDIGAENVSDLLKQSHTALNQVRKMFKINSKEPLIKGGITIFALKQRYDYSEFGTMLESRSLPPEWSSHWRYDNLDVYVAMVFDKAANKINETSLVQQFTSLWLSSFEGVPKWFADGAGRQALAVSVGINDARVQPWIKRLPESMSQIKDLKPFLQGSMNDEDSATIGFGVIRFMVEAKMKAQYDAIIRSLASGMSFEQATTKSIGPIELFLQKVLGRSK